MPKSLRFKNLIFIILLIIITSFTFSLSILAASDGSAGVTPNHSPIIIAQNGTSNVNSSYTNNGNGTPIKDPITIPATTGFNTIGTLINNFAQLILPLSGIGFAAAIIYSGYVRMFSIGNSDQVKLSMNISKYAAIGFALIFFSSLIVVLVGGVLNLTV